MKCHGSSLLLLPLLFLSAYAASLPAAPDALEPGDCQDPFTRSAAEQAMNAINRHRRQGYVFALNRLRDAHHMKHGPTGVVFYLTLDVVETKCHVLSKRLWKSCEVREAEDTPIYGQCKATIYINKVQRIVRLYKYDCVARPAPVARIVEMCPDCPTTIPHDNADVVKTVKMALDKYNKDSGNANYFCLLNITRSSMQGGIADFTFADFIIQESVCSNDTDVAKAPECTLMDCEFAHKGHCSASYHQSPEENSIKVDCDIFEPEEAEREKQRHLLGGEQDHGHNHTLEHTHEHDHTHEHEQGQEHALDHEHTHGEAHEHDHTHGHGDIHYHSHEHDNVHHHDDHEHTHDHAHEHDHAHNDHTHENGHPHNHTHDPEHTHEHAPGDLSSHNGTHDHAHDHIHYYGDHHHHHHHHHHGNHTHAHEHDHEHKHEHGHLHAHEHHHHHHDHDEKKGAFITRGEVHYLPDLNSPVVMPAFPETELPGEQEVPILPFPTSRSPKCVMNPKRGGGLVDELLAEDPLFKTA